MFSRTVALKFSQGQRVEPATFECVTVYFSDIVGYTTITDQSSAVEMVEFLNALYRMTDRIVANYDAYKMETIGDADLVSKKNCSTFSGFYQAVKGLVARKAKLMLQRSCKRYFCSN